jgi:hypothetical protein
VAKVITKKTLLRIRRSFQPTAINPLRLPQSDYSGTVPSALMASLTKTNNSSRNFRGEDVVAAARRANVLASCYMVDAAGSLKGFLYCSTVATGTLVPEPSMPASMSPPEPKSDRRPHARGRVVFLRSLRQAYPPHPPAPPTVLSAPHTSLRTSDSNSNSNTSSNSNSSNSNSSNSNSSNSIRNINIRSATSEISGRHSVRMDSSRRRRTMASQRQRATVSRRRALRRPPPWSPGCTSTTTSAARASAPLWRTMGKSARSSSSSTTASSTVI